MKKTYKEKRRGRPLSTTTTRRTQLLLYIYIDTYTHIEFFPMTLQIHSECQGQYIAPKSKSLTSSAVQKQSQK